MANLLSRRLVYLVEQPSIAEKLRLRLLPTAELLDRDQFNFGKIQPRASRTRLDRSAGSGSWRRSSCPCGEYRKREDTLRRPFQFRVSWRNLSTTATERLRQYREAMDVTISNLSAPEFLLRKIRLALPCDEYIALAALCKRQRDSAARPGIEHGYIFIQLPNPCTCLGFVVAVGSESVCPCSNGNSSARRRKSSDSA